MTSPAEDILAAARRGMQEIKEYLATNNLYDKSDLMDQMIRYRNIYQVADMVGQADVRLQSKGISLGTKPRTKEDRAWDPIGVSANGQHSRTVTGTIPAITASNSAIGRVTHQVFDLTSAIQPNTLQQPGSEDH